MKILNLVYSENSDVKYKISKFPDNQQQITIIGIKGNRGLGDTDVIKLEKDIIIEIKARLNNFQDLELIICATQSLKLLGIKEIHLYVPYFLGARSDRQFEEGSNNYLKHVICPIINLQGYSSVTILDPHSSSLEACLNGFKSISNKQLIGFTINDIYGLPKDIHKNLKNCILISPDAGASHKIYKLAEQIRYKGDIITCSKERDKDGRLTKCVVPNIISTCNKDYIIVDDICDGGATFINIAKTIKETREFSSIVHPSQYGKIYLIITHSIFSKGLTELSKYFDKIYTTNSYADHPNRVTKEDPILVKQLNIF